MENKYLTAQRTMNLPQQAPMPMQQQVMMKQQMMAGFGAPKAPATKKGTTEKEGLGKYFTKDKILGNAARAAFLGAIICSVKD